MGGGAGRKEEKIGGHRDQRHQRDQRVFSVLGYKYIYHYPPDNIRRYFHDKEYGDMISFLPEYPS